MQPEDNFEKPMHNEYVFRHRTRTILSEEEIPEFGIVQIIQTQFFFLLILSAKYKYRLILDHAKLLNHCPISSSNTSINYIFEIKQPLKSGL